MKYLIVILVVGLVVWLMLRGAKPKPKAKPGAPGDAAPKEMVECGHCGVHLPRSDAVEARNGVFCSEAHRLAGPRAN